MRGYEGNHFFWNGFLFCVYNEHLLRKPSFGMGLCFVFIMHGYEGNLFFGMGFCTVFVRSFYEGNLFVGVVFCSVFIRSEYAGNQCFEIAFCFKI